MTQYSQFDVKAIQLRDISERGHDLTYDHCLQVAAPSRPCHHPDLPRLARAIHTARDANRPVIAILGAHVIKLGLSRYIIELVERRWITHVALNGAGVIHDFELATLGGTSEDVAKWIRVGQFGLWRETSRLNEIISEGARRGEGFGESVGRSIEETRAAYRDVSICRTAWCAGVPVTSHVTLGADILHAMPNCDGAAIGATSMTDFLIFARTVQQLDGGVVLNIGSAVTGPEVFLKALSMARNVATQEGQAIDRFTTAVFDLMPLPKNPQQGPPPKNQPLYYFRPWKTLLCRTVGSAGDSVYIEGDHRQTVPTLWHALMSPPTRSQIESRESGRTCGRHPTSKRNVGALQRRHQ